MRLSGQSCSVLVSVQRQICVYKKSIRNGGRSKTNGLLMFSETRFILPESVIENTMALSEGDLARVDLFAKDIALLCLHAVAGHKMVIISFDDQLLPLTHTCAGEVDHRRRLLPFCGRRPHEGTAELYPWM